MAKKTQFLLVMVLSGLMTACVSVGEIADSLSAAIMNQTDPDIVSDGLPAYLLLLDAMIEQEPNDEELLIAAARLNSAYAGGFVVKPERMRQISSKALAYARRAICLEYEDLCTMLQQPLDQYSGELHQIDDDSDVPFLYAFVTAWAGYIQAHSDNWQAIADLPKVQATIEWVLELDERFDQGGAHLYLGVLLTLRPATLGGQPERGRQHFLRAIELSAGRNLMAKVMYARYYARLVFDQKLHDQLLNEVLAADVEASKLSLLNTLAKQQAKELLAGSNDYF